MTKKKFDRLRQCTSQDFSMRKDTCIKILLLWAVVQGGEMSTLPATGAKVVPGQNATITCDYTKVGGNINIRAGVLYYWYKNTTEIVRVNSASGPNPNGTYGVFLDEIHKKAYFHIAKVSTSDLGCYICKMIDSDFNHNSGIACLILNDEGPDTENKVGAGNGHEEFNKQAGDEARAADSHKPRLTTAEIALTVFVVLLVIAVVCLIIAFGWKHKLCYGKNTYVVCHGP